MIQPFSFLQNKAVVASDPDVAAWLSSVKAAGSTVSQAAVDLYDSFVSGLKSDSLWTSIFDMTVFMGPSTLAGALKKLKGSGVVTNQNYVSSDYIANAGITGGSGKRLNLGSSAVEIGLTTSSAMMAGYITNQISSPLVSNLIYDGSISAQATNCGIYRSAATPTILRARILGTTELTVPGGANQTGLVIASRSGTAVSTYMNSVENTYTNTGATTNVGIRIGGATVNNSHFKGTFAGYMFGSTDGTIAQKNLYKARWDTLINGLKAL